MHVRRQLRDRKSVILLASFFTLYVVSEVNRHMPLQVWERKVRLTIAAVHRAEEREERLVLVNWQELAVAERPISGGKVPGDDFYFANEWCSHAVLRSVFRIACFALWGQAFVRRAL